MKRVFPAFLLCLTQLVKLSSQTTFPSNGAPYQPHTVYAFINANIQTDPDNQISRGTLLIQDGKVIGAGPKLSVPSHAVVYDLNGKYIYPSFIDLFSDYGVASNK